MIYYFSGTGNSKYVAKCLAENLKSDFTNICDYIDNLNSKKSFELDSFNDEIIGFVCPVHSWGPAIMMIKFLQLAKFKNINPNAKKFVVFVCGDTCGNSRDIINKSLKINNLQTQKVFSVQMPNNYIVMKGFGIDSKELQEQKIQNAKPMIDKICESILGKSDFENYVIGTKPGLKSGLIYPLFKKFATSDKNFYVDENCISCKQCVGFCEQKNITFENNKPKWNHNCSQCLSCIHRCPKSAIQYGKITKESGRYFFKEN